MFGSAKGLSSDSDRYSPGQNIFVEARSGTRL